MGIEIQGKRSGRGKRRLYRARADLEKGQSGKKCRIV